MELAKRYNVKLKLKFDLRPALDRRSPQPLGYAALLARVPVCFESHRADVAQRGVKSAMVVERQPVDYLIHRQALRDAGRAALRPQFETTRPDLPCRQSVTPNL